MTFPQFGSNSTIFKVLLNKIDQKPGFFQAESFCVRVSKVDAILMFSISNFKLNSLMKCGTCNHRLKPRGTNLVGGGGKVCDHQVSHPRVQIETSRGLLDLLEVLTSFQRGARVLVLVVEVPAGGGVVVVEQVRVVPVEPVVHHSRHHLRDRVC